MVDNAAHFSVNRAARNTPMNDVDIATLLQQAAAGDGRAADRLLAPYRDRLRRMAELRLDRRLRGRVDADDIVQETFLQAVRRLPGGACTSRTCGSSRRRGTGKTTVPSSTCSIGRFRKTASRRLYQQLLPSTVSDPHLSADGQRLALARGRAPRIRISRLSIDRPARSCGRGPVRSAARPSAGTGDGSRFTSSIRRKSSS